MGQSSGRSLERPQNLDLGVLDKKGNCRQMTNDNVGETKDHMVTGISER